MARNIRRRVRKSIRTRSVRGSGYRTQEEGAQGPQCAKRRETQGPWRRDGTGCCRLSRQLLARYGWTVACAGLFVSFVALMDKPVEGTAIRYSVWIGSRCNPWRFDEILNSVCGPSCLKMANSSDLRRARQCRGWHATCSQDCAHYAFALLVAHPSSDVRHLVAERQFDDPRKDCASALRGNGARMLSARCVPFFALQACFEGACFRFR